jgi:predicted nucleic acid-binding protein
MNLLLDASVWLAATDLDDPLHAPSRELVRSGEHSLAALDLTVYEVAKVVTRRWGDPERARHMSTLVFEACEERLIRVASELAEEAVDTAHRERITVYDAAYVAAAAREGLTLVSGDVADLVKSGLARAPDYFFK